MIWGVELSAMGGKIRTDQKKQGDRDAKISGATAPVCSKPFEGRRHGVETYLRVVRKKKKNQKREKPVSRAAAQADNTYGKTKKEKLDLG